MGAEHLAFALGPSGGKKKVSCMSRAGWPGGKFKAVKFSQSVSMSGPSATEKPMIGEDRGELVDTWLIGWTRPRPMALSRKGSVRSRRSAASRASSAAPARAFLRSFSAACARSAQTVDQRARSRGAPPASSSPGSSAIRKLRPSCRAPRRAPPRAPPRRAPPAMASRRSRSSAAKSDIPSFPRSNSMRTTYEKAVRRTEAALLPSWLGPVEAHVPDARPRSRRPLMRSRDNPSLSPPSPRRASRRSSRSRRVRSS